MKQGHLKIKKRGPETRRKTNPASNPSLSLGKGAKIAIIGAGPAGTFFADFASRLSEEKALGLSIVLFDGKDFTRKGPAGCNLCAGVISETLVNRLEGQGIVLPEERVQRNIGGYYLRGRAGGLLLKHRLNERRITTVFRGNGPRLSSQAGNISFDDFLLEKAGERGTMVVRKPVKRIKLSKDPSGPVEVIYGVGKEEETWEADLVVGAFGLNQSMMKRMEGLGFGYHPPRMVQAWNVEVRLKEDFIRKTFDDNIFAYNLSTARGMHVASIIPKKDFITVNMVGVRDVRREELADFLDFLVTRGKLPRYWNWSYHFCSCAPKIPVASARKPYTDRLVIIGDASCCRYFKNGIESAFLTAKVAAETAFMSGVSERDFRRGYFRKIKKLIVRDNFFGRVLFVINNLVSGRRFCSEVMFRVAEAEEKRGKTTPMRDVLWNMYTGNIPYRTIFLRFINPVLQAKLTACTVMLLVRRLLMGLGFSTEKRK